MKTLTKTDRSASALVIAMLVVFLMAAFIGVAMYLTTGTCGRQIPAAIIPVCAAPTEGALDFAYGVWAKTVNSYYAPATQAQINTAMATVPAFNGYGYAQLPRTVPSNCLR